MNGSLKDGYEVELFTVNNIRARFVTEQFTYYNPEPISIQICLATTTSGGRLVSDHHDVTGIMLWPASHLMCQHLIQGDIVGEQESVVELGCGCGLVSLIGGMFGNKSTRLWVATDVDSEALQLCRKNFDLQGCHNKVNDRMRIQKLAWGDKDQIKKLLEQIGNCEGGLKRFDSIIGADIIYPDTSNETLDALFQTVNTLLKSDGTFWLAFATRDGPKTPSRLLLAAGEAGFAVSILPPLAADVLKKLPPLLDSKLLVLRRDPDAIEHNLRRIDDVFPGLHAALERLENPSSDEEWEAPFAD